jgi:hypothetical protein
VVGTRQARVRDRDDVALAFRCWAASAPLRAAHRRPRSVRSLHEATPPFDTPTEKLADVIRRVTPIASGHDQTVVASAPALSDAAEWQTLASQLDHIALDLAIEDAAAEPAELARYSLVTGHDWHVWKARPMAVASPAALPMRVSGTVSMI